MGASSAQSAREMAASPAFRDEVRDVIQRLRGAVADICFALPGGAPERASRLASALDLDEGLAWKLMKVVNAEDPFEATAYLPGPSGVKIFLRAARQKKVAEEVVSRADGAFSAYRRLVREHAGDRKSFDMMAAGQVERDRLRADNVHRKGAFQHLSYLYGIQARAEVRVYALNASSAADTYDVLTIRGFTNVRRIRESVPWRMSRLYAIDDAGNIQTQFVREPLDPAAAREPASAGLPLLGPFCSTPMPTFRCVPRARGFDDYLLSDDRLGNVGQFTCFTGEIVRAAEPRYRDERHRELSVTAGLRTPCERLLIDVLVHRSLFDSFTPAAALYCDAFMRDPSEPFQPWDRMPIHETIQPLGRGMSAVFAREVPRYRELIAYGFAQARWNSDEFDVYRFVMSYPPVPTTVTIIHPLPERPN